MLGNELIGILPCLAILVLVFYGAMTLKKYKSKNNEESKTTSNKGCSIAFYILLGLIVLYFVFGYIMYQRAQG